MSGSNANSFPHLDGLSADQLRRLLVERQTQQNLGLYWEHDNLDRDGAIMEHVVRPRVVPELCHRDTSLRKSRMKVTSSRALALSLVFCASVLSRTALAADSRVTTPRGLPVEMLVDMPDGPGPFPALVLAPGQGYHARLPLLERTAKDLTSRGVAVIRFNWAYFLKDGNKGKPADDLATEVEDMKAVLAETRKLPRIDPDRGAVAGKSLGSLVAWRVFRADTTLRAAALLTPVCIDMTSDSRRDAALTNHPDIASNTRPLLLLAGDADAICPVRFLYGAAATISGGARVVVIGGDHGFATKAGPNAAQESEANMALAVRTTADFIAATLK